MTEREKNILSHKLIPQPRSAAFKDGAEYQIADGCAIELKTTAALRDEAHAYAEMTVLDYWQTMPVIAQTELKKKLHPEGYEITATADKLSVSASNIAGLRNAFRTLRQLAEPERGVECFSHYILTQCTIKDAPSLDFRGIHLCWFPETTVCEMEKQIRLAAYFKFNFVVIEFWGVYPFKSHPEFCFEDKKIKRKEIKRLIDLAISLGITPIPQINLFGHASWARSCNGKHATLDAHPELQSLMEPDGWSWCLTNPATREILSDLVEELLDVFQNPPYFHAGCDEADNLATCSTCRKADLKTIIAEHLTYFHDLLAKHGARMMMWHDMLLEKDDPRWKGYIVNALKQDRLADLWKLLPKDIVICDWQYGRPNPESAVEWPTCAFFKENGFDVLVSPWNNPDGAQELIRFAEKEKLFGLLETTWHMNYGEYMPALFIPTSCAAWNTNYASYGSNWSDRTSVHSMFNLYLRQIAWDMGTSEYEDTGRAPYQIPPVRFNRC